MKWPYNLAGGGWVPFLLPAQNWFKPPFIIYPPLVFIVAIVPIGLWSTCIWRILGFSIHFHRYTCFAWTNIFASKTQLEPTLVWYTGLCPLSTLIARTPPVLISYWVRTWLSTQLLITYLDDLIIIQVGYQSLNTNAKTLKSEFFNFLNF
jgi:hypothetical protein